MTDTSAAELPPEGMTYDDIVFDSETDTISVPKLGLSLSLRHKHFLAREALLDKVLSLFLALGAGFSETEDGYLLVTIGETRFRVADGPDLETLHEVCFLNVYGIDFNRPAVYVDIGMNVGFASLYLAAKANAVAVWGFEPFPRTYKQAEANFALNPRLSSIIRPFKAGIGSKNKTTDIVFDAKSKAMIGVSSDERRLAPRGAPETIDVRGIIEVLDEIERAHPGVDLVLKVDCEGDEYEIFDTLAQTGRLAKVAAVMVEWHHGPERLLAQLQKADFVTFCQTSPFGTFGMIHAVKRGK